MRSVRGGGEVGREKGARGVCGKRMGVPAFALVLGAAFQIREGAWRKSGPELRRRGPGGCWALV